MYGILLGLILRIQILCTFFHDTDFAWLKWRDLRAPNFVYVLFGYGTGKDIHEYLH